MHHSPDMKLRSLTIAAVLMIALVAAPATAAAPDASKGRWDTWAGQVVRHRHHFDYQGSYCPTSAEACIKIFATFRIVPVTPEAAVGLRRAAGGAARLVGYRTPASDGKHNGVLYVRRVRKA